MSSNTPPHLRRRVEDFMTNFVGEAPAMIPVDHTKTTEQSREHVLINQIVSYYSVDLESKTIRAKDETKPVPGPVYMLARHLCDELGYRMYQPTKPDHPLLKFFKYEHLPSPLKETSAQFADLALWVDVHLPEGVEKDVALRKLLEAKDAAVRARLP